VLFLDGQLSTSSQVEVYTAHNRRKDYNANNNAGSDNSWVASTTSRTV
jgi:hypothetical protein